MIGLRHIGEQYVPTGAELPRYDHSNREVQGLRAGIPSS